MMPRWLKVALIMVIVGQAIFWGGKALAVSYPTHEFLKIYFGLVLVVLIVGVFGGQYRKKGGNE